MYLREPQPKPGIVPGGYHGSRLRIAISQMQQVRGTPGARPGDAPSQHALPVAPRAVFLQRLLGRVRVVGHLAQVVGRAKDLVVALVCARRDLVVAVRAEVLRRVVPLHGAGETCAEDGRHEEDAADGALDKKSVCRADVWTLVWFPARKGREKWAGERVMEWK
jgi:hypothetical protein